MKQIEVSIMGQSYRLACPDGGEERLRDAVSQVDREMCAIRDRGKLKARERIAVLAALNLAYVQSEGGHDSAVKQSASELPQGCASVDPGVLSSLVARLDQALGDDGQLI